MTRFSDSLCVLFLMAALAEPASAGEFVTYSNLRYTANHEYGSTVELWRDGTALVGLFSHSSGRLQGDTPAGLIENVTLDLRTGHFSFTSRLTEGEHACKVHKFVPSQDVFSFEGTLTNESLSGTLKRADGLHPEMPPTVEAVSLQRVASTVPPASREKWETAMKQILQFRGPRTVSGVPVFSADGGTAKGTELARKNRDQVFISLSAAGQIAKANGQLQLSIPSGQDILVPILLQAAERDRSVLTVTGTNLEELLNTPSPRRYLWYQNGNYIGEGERLRVELGAGAHVIEVRVAPASQVAASTDMLAAGANQLALPSAKAGVVVSEEQSWNCRGRLGSACRDGKGGSVATAPSQIEFDCGGVAGRVCITSRMSIGSIKHDRCCDEELARGNVGMWCAGIPSLQPNPTRTSACEPEWEQAKADAVRLDGAGTHAQFEYKWTYPAIAPGSPSSGAHGWWLGLAEAGAVVNQARPTDDAEYCRSRRVKTVQVRSVVREGIATGPPRKIWVPVWVCD